MPALIGMSNAAWKRQPTNLTRVNASNWLGSLVYMGCLPSVTSLPVSSPSIVNSLGANQFGFGSSGGAGNFATSDGVGSKLRRAAGVSAANSTFSMGFVYSTNSSNYWLWDGQSDGNSNAFLIRVIDDYYSIRIGGNFVYGGSGGTAVPAPAGTVKMLLCSGFWNGPAARLYVNSNVYNGDGAGDSWRPIKKITAVFGSSAHPHMNFFSGVGNLFLFFRRELSDQEAVSWIENPWQIFAPAPSRFYLIPTAPALTIPTLSSPGVTDITATAARPQVTLTY